MFREFTIESSILLEENLPREVHMKITNWLSTAVLHRSVRPEP